MFINERIRDVTVSHVRHEYVRALESVVVTVSLDDHAIDCLSGLFTHSSGKKYSFFYVSVVYYSLIGFVVVISRMISHISALFVIIRC